METELDLLVKKLKNLAQYKNKTEEELISIAEKQIENNRFLDKLSFVNDDDEKKYARDLFESYMSEYEITDVGDKDTLYQLIDLELLAFKIKKAINDSGKDAKGAIPMRLVETLHQHMESITKLKQQLGMTKAEKEKNTSDAVRAIESLKIRFKLWINQAENKANYTLKCPHCLSYVLIRRRIDKDKDEVLEHPWFINGGILFNRYLFQYLEEGKLTEEEVCNILKVSKDYLGWIRKKFRIECNAKIEEPKPKENIEPEKND
jgi:hypothetical protein